MKKISIFLGAITIMSSFNACSTSGPKADLKTDVDSVAYSIGLAQTTGLKGYLAGRMNIDTTYIDAFVKGLNEGFNASGKKEDAYLAGVQIGHQMGNQQMIDGLNKQLFPNDSTKSVNKNNILAGFIDGVLEEFPVMTREEAQEYSRKGMEAAREKSVAEKFAANKEAGEKFLEENKSKEGVTTTESGLQYEIIKKGNGAVPTKESTVKVNYKGTLIDGTVFDSSYERNAPATFRADRVIKGWTEALTMMPVGSKWKIYVPQDLAYGSRDNGKIKPFSTLIFEVELLSIQDKK